MAEPDIAHAVKEILGARVVYIFSCLHLAGSIREGTFFFIGESANSTMDSVNDVLCIVD